MYNKYKKMIKMFVFKTYLKSGIDYDELDAQANLLFCEALNDYDQKKSKFSTYLYIYLQNGLKNYVYNEKKQKKIFNSLSNLSDLYYIYNHKEKKTISKETTFIINMLIDDYEKVRSFTKNKYGGKISKNCLLKYLLDLGWKRQKINQTFCEIKILLRENLI